jgi:prepilin-type N-terminal cleavage/methylation domain-containing protein
MDLDKSDDTRQSRKQDAGKQPEPAFTGIIRGESGMTLVEVVISLTVLGVVLSGLILALSTATLSVGNVTTRSTAADLGLSQIELIKSTPFTTTYPTITYPSGYSVTTAVSTIQSNLQIVTATVTFDGRQLYQAAAYKSNVIP